MPENQASVERFNFVVGGWIRARDFPWITRGTVFIEVVLTPSITPVVNLFCEFVQFFGCHKNYPAPVKEPVVLGYCCGLIRSHKAYPKIES